MSFNIVIKRYIREARAEETRKFKVEGSSVRIGTGAGNEIQLEGLGVSINHAVIEKGDYNTYWLTDLGTGSTYVNNNLISKKHQIADRDEIKIGPYTLKITIPAAAEEPATILVTQVEGIEEEDVPPDRKEEKVRYVSKYKLSTSLFSKTILSVLGIALICLFTVFWVTSEDKEVFSPGPLSDAHTQFNDDCGKCHTVAWDTVPNRTCLECHKTDPHNKNELFTPDCVQCHFEHKGNPVLADLEDDFCTQCHSDLLIKGYVPSPNYAREIQSFNSGHPEFAVAVRQDGNIIRAQLNDKNNLKDNTPIDLNHMLHINPPPDKKALMTENLRCENCHRVDANGEYTLPIEYERDCARCHTLEFDLRFGSKVVPHEPTDVVDEFLQKTYTEYAVNNANRLGLGGSASAIRQWVSLRVKETENVLFGLEEKCRKCHTLEEVDDGLPKVVKPKIPVRWLPHGKFDHELHVKNLGLKCGECHNAETSEETEDVLMPSINDCQQCHSAEGGAKTECVLCHEYHQREGKGKIKGTKTIKEVLDSK